MVSVKLTIIHGNAIFQSIWFFEVKKGSVVSKWAFKDNKADAKRYPWVLTVDDYAVLEGIKVPSKMKDT